METCYNRGIYARDPGLLNVPYLGVESLSNWGVASPPLSRGNIFVEQDFTLGGLYPATDVD